MRVLLIPSRQEQGYFGTPPGQGSDGGRSILHDPEHSALRADGNTLYQNLFRDSRAPSLSTVHQCFRDGQESLPIITPEHNDDGEQRTRSERSKRNEPEQSEGRKNEAHNGKKDQEKQYSRKASYICGAGAVALSEDNSKLPPKQYTKLWYCHLKCWDCGPWRSQVTR